MKEHDVRLVPILEKKEKHYSVIVDVGGVPQRRAIAAFLFAVLEEWNLTTVVDGEKVSLPLTLEELETMPLPLLLMTYNKVIQAIVTPDQNPLDESMRGEWDA